MRNRNLGFLIILTTCTTACIIEVDDPEGDCEVVAETVCDDIDFCARELGVVPAPAFSYPLASNSECVESMITLLNCAEATSSDAAFLDDCSAVTSALECNRLLDPVSGKVDISACQ